MVLFPKGMERDVTPLDLEIDCSQANEVWPLCRVWTLVSFVVAWHDNFTLSDQTATQITTNNASVISKDVKMGNYNGLKP